MVECWPALEFECEKCGEIQYCDNNLEPEMVDGRVVSQDTIDCDKCSHENRIFQEL